jgi:methionyl-tRNA formyltransferase
VTTFFMEEGVDTGNVIASRATDIGPDETAGQLLERLSVLGAEVVVETCGLVEAGSAKPVAQDHGLASYAPKLTKQDGRVIWGRPAQAVHNHVRGMSPWPGAFCMFRDQPLKILATHLDPAGARGARRSDEGLGLPGPAGMGPAGMGPAATGPAAAGPEPGTVIGIDSDGAILVSCSSGSVRLLALQAQGKRATASADFARGYRIKAGDHFA